ncbi:MAG: hypothetical protein ACRD1F_07375 [Terriglobales bacterium]
MQPPDEERDGASAPTTSASRSGTRGAAALGPAPNNGVDCTLIRAFLALTPAERLQAIEDRQDDLERILRHIREPGRGR